MNIEHKSFWLLEKRPRFTALEGDLQAGAVIVGAGICGLLCAYFLQRKGVSDIVIIEANEVGSGVTANTTAKITSQHGLIYAKLLRGFGEEAALQYASANQKAIRHYREIVRQEHIDCGLTACNAWLYATSPEYRQELEDELQAAQKLGVDAAFEQKTELPFPVEGALRFPDQAYFHPLQFAFQLCDILVKAGCRIYTRTKATGAEEGIVYTDKGNIRAEHILICSHYPFIDKHSLLFTKIFQERSYVLVLQGMAPIRDMYLDCAESGYSFRPQKDKKGQDMILFGAFDHKTGHEKQNLHYAGLSAAAEQCYPDGKPVYKWSAQDCMTHDGVPYIGRYATAGKNIYLATGFNKWGMTSSMAAADILSDLITKGDHAAQQVFSLDRQDIKLQAKSFVVETIDIVGNFLTHLTTADEALQNIQKNEGGIVEINGKRAGVYRDHSGKRYAVKPVCTHMGCAIAWNKDENSWDCTCHGSRFDYLGNVIGGPALKPLEQIPVELQ